MKVLHVAQIHWYNAEVQYAWDLARVMGEMGHQVHALTRPDCWASEGAEKAGLTLFTEDDFNRKGFSSWRTIPAISRCYNLLQKERYDLVVIHRSEGMALIAAACRWAGIPCVRVRGDMRPVKANFANSWVYASLLDAVAASNGAIAEGLKERLGVDATVIHGGVDERLFNPDGPNAGIKEELGFEPGAFLVGLLGRMVPLKGHCDFLDAAKIVLKEVPEAAFVLLVKSDFPPLPEVAARLAADPLLASRVRYLGQQPDLPAVLRDFGVGVVASTGSEANCRVGLEWMASGVPLVATRVGVLPEIVKEGETGALVSPARPSEMAEKIIYFARRPEEAVRQGNLARKRVEERFTLTHTARAFTALAKRVVEKRCRK